MSPDTTHSYPTPRRTPHVVGMSLDVKGMQAIIARTPHVVGMSLQLPYVYAVGTRTPHVVGMSREQHN